MIYRLLFSTICLLCGIPCIYISKYWSLPRNSKEKKNIHFLLSSKLVTLVFFSVQGSAFPWSSSKHSSIGYMLSLRLSVSFPDAPDTLPEPLQSTGTAGSSALTDCSRLPHSFHFQSCCSRGANPEGQHSQLSVANERRRCKTDISTEWALMLWKIAPIPPFTIWSGTSAAVVSLNVHLVLNLEY